MSKQNDNTNPEQPQYHQTSIDQPRGGLVPINTVKKQTAVSG